MTSNLRDACNAVGCLFEHRQPTRLFVLRLSGVILIAGALAGCLPGTTTQNELAMDVYKIKMAVQDLESMAKETSLSTQSWQSSFALENDIRARQLNDRLASLDVRLMRIEELLRRLLEQNAGAGMVAPQKPDAPTVSAPPPVPTAPIVETANELWNQGVQAMDAEDYQNALAVFERLQNLYPSAPEADDALFESGAALEAMGKTTEAIKTFLSVPAKYPAGNRSPQAMFRAAQCHVSLGDIPTARKILNDILVKYPSRGGHPQVHDLLNQIKDQ